MILLNSELITHQLRNYINETIWSEIQLYCRRIGKYCPYTEIEKINLKRSYQYHTIRDVIIEMKIDKVIVVFKDNKKIIKSCCIKISNEKDYYEKVVNQAKYELNMI